MATLAEHAVALLRTSGVRLAPGLDDTEMAQVQDRYGIRFGDDHRALLHLAVPLNSLRPDVGGEWVDWRDDDETAIRRRLDAPLDGIVLAVLRAGFWPRSWAPRPTTGDRAVEATAREHMTSWPVLLPLYAHRYLPAAPAPLGSPVFSVVQTDVVYYGADLVDYLHPLPRNQPQRQPRYGYPPWSDLAHGATDDDL